MAESLAGGWHNERERERPVLYPEGRRGGKVRQTDSAIGEGIYTTDILYLT